MGKANTKKYRTAKLWMWCAEVVERKDTLRRFLSRGNIPHTHWRFHKLPPALQGQGLVNHSTLMMMDSQYTLIWSVSLMNKHLIKFPIALHYSTLRGWNKMGNSTGSTGRSNCSTMLLKADTGADVNLMNRKTFDQLFGEAKVLQPTSIRMENYGNTAVKVLGMFHAFLRWKDKVYTVILCDRL